MKITFNTLSLLLLIAASILTVRGDDAEPAPPNTWQADATLVQKLLARKDGVIYRESDVPDYELPELFDTRGKEKMTAQIWKTKRRGEILELFETHVFGKSPKRPHALKFNVFEKSSTALNSTALRKQVRVSFTQNDDGPGMDVLIYLPAKAEKPVPLFLLLNFRGNHTVCDDPAVRLTESWIPNGEEANEASRGKRSQRYPVESIIARGYGFATIYCGDIDPDYHDGFKNGVHPLFDNPADGKRDPDSWGTIAAWAWGLSRAMDYFETDSDIDHTKIAVLGHSRLGKTSLWAGATDERFAMVISNNSGCGGAALSRRCYGEALKRINTRFPHWFCENFQQYNGNESSLPVDQHMLIALIAPRPAYIASADQDLWADPRGEFLSAKYASPAWELMGLKGLGAEQMPPLNTPIQNGHLGYHIRDGKHDLTEYDWQRYMDFADKHLR
ncbi:hypothetical protein SMSP2_02490 [Limihaloglobus sulfuriphilus]|uniref:4-O-methyl-glucuronoyl methylesterase-like domain-containing protein n=1 Tax=Limihaloglobus sulfuriphilus TaxID=1851148 RepID=A0A1Q2MHE2_9BACT|nr:hypothetical protein [Limihaloglobus sulfuriphilus]AQQ72110.1 hypothetical protein SMSP2_02490 [Limihaloglobus sulfuriphilus]